MTYTMDPLHICFHIFATNVLYTSYVVELKPDKFVARRVHCDVHV